MDLDVVPPYEHRVGWGTQSQLGRNSFLGVGFAKIEYRWSCAKQPLGTAEVGFIPREELWDAINEC